MNKNKILIILVTILLCFLIIAIAHFQYFETRAKILELYGEKQVILAKQIALSLQNYFQERIRGLKMLANKYGRGRPDWPELSNNLDYLFGKNIYGEQVLFINASNKIDYCLSRSHKIPGHADLPTELRQQMLSFHLQNSDTLQANIRLSKSADINKSRVYISVPAYSSDNRFQGVVIDIIYLNETLKEIITPFMDTYGAHAFLLSDKGEILYHPYHPERTFKKLSSWDKTCKKCHQNFTLEKKMLEQESGWGEKEDYGDKKLLSFASVYLANINWIAAVKTPYDEIARANRKQFLIFFLLSASMMLFVFLGSMAFYRINKNRIEMEKERQLRHQEHLAFIGEMSTRIAHEIKNPLASLQTGIQLLESTLDMDEESHEYFKRLTAEIHRVDGIVKGLLAYARQEQLNRTKINPVSLIQSVIELIKPTLKDKTINWKLSLPESNLVIQADIEKMEQVLWNLIINSVQAIEKEGIIEILVQKEQNKEVHIKIIDNGCGISGRTLAKIFQPFFSTRSQGTGLGLAISKKIIEEHNGKIRIESKVGQGTCVEIILPGL